ncbi:MAG: SCO family protein [Solirubrobacteraceae bacterium]
MLSRRRNAALVLATALAAMLSGCSGHGSSSTSSSGFSTGPESGFDGAPFPAGIGAPSFTLTDQYGRRVSLGDYRGQVVLLTFLYSTCGDTCVVIAQQIRGALDELEGEHARRPTVLIVSADPTADSPAHVRSFLSEVSLTGRVQYLTGSLAQLRSIWRAYGIKPASVGAREFDEYASVLLLDRSGEKRVLFESEELTPEALSHDVLKLDGDPARP